MDKQILKFARLLRRAGLRISSSEINDCLEGIKLVGIEKPVFFETLRATFVKEEHHYPVFRLAFELFFGQGFDGTSTVTDSGSLSSLKTIRNESNEEGIARNKSQGSGGQGTGVGSGYMERFVHVIKVGSSEQYSELVREGIARL